MIGRYHDAVAHAVTDHGGHIAKYLGDGVLAYFGWPHAREDSADRAIRAAMAALAAVGRMEVDGASLAARAGIATGPVVIGDMTGEHASERGAVVGATPNLAARLQALAGPGEVIIQAATRRLVGGAFELESRGAKELKGFAEPVAVWRVVRAARTDSRFDALHGALLTEFVGRAHEIDLLRDRWQRARDGEGQAVLVSGEAGIGKSRILREFTVGLDGAPCRILRYQCSPHEVNAAFQPIVSEIEAASETSRDDPPDRRLDALESHLAAVFDDPAEAAPLIAALLSLPLARYPPLEMAPQRRKQRTIALLTERVARLARARPVLLLVEDLHWIDPSSLETLDAIVERIQDLPVLAVMTHRPSFPPRWTGHGHVTQHSLTRLTRSDGRAIAERVAGGKALPAELLDRIVEQTDGVPLFVEELTRAILETDLLEERQDRYTLTGPVPTLAIPTTLQDSLMARLDRLAPVKRVIQAAACIGREFDADLLAAALRMERDEIDEALDQLVDAQLVFRRGGAEDARYIFKHALVQDAAYASLLTGARRSLHGKLADALAASEDPDALALARHRAGAGQHADAARLYLAAGRQSLGASALPEAVGALELGLGETGALAPSAERDRLELDLRVALGTARMASFGWAHPSVAEAFEPAFPLARGFADEDAFVSILWGLWVHYQTRTDFPRAHEWLAELETVARESAGSDLAAVHDMSAGCQYFWEADHARAIRHTDRLRSVYEPERHARLTALTNHDPLVFAQHWAGSLADWIRGYPDRSVERMGEALTLARRIGHPFNLVFALTAGATSLIYLDRADSLLACCDEAEKVVADEALGPFSERVNVMQWRGGAQVQRGAFETGYALAKEGNDFWNASGGRICNAMFRSWIVRGLAGLGRIGEAVTLNLENIAHCRETGDRYMEPECVRLQGELTLARDASGVTEAGHLFREAMAIAEAHDAKSWELRAATSLARLLHQEGDPGAAASLEPVLAWFTEGHDTRDLREAATLLAEIG